MCLFFCRVFNSTATPMEQETKAFKTFAFETTHPNYVNARFVHCAFCVQFYFVFGLQWAWTFQPIWLHVCIWPFNAEFEHLMCCKPIEIVIRNLYFICDGREEACIRNIFALELPKCDESIEREKSIFIAISYGFIDILMSEFSFRPILNSCHEYSMAEALVGNKAFQKLPCYSPYALDTQAIICSSSSFWNGYWEEMPSLEYFCWMGRKAEKWKV